MQQFLGSRFRELRKQAGLSLNDLANKIGLTKSFLSQVERGRKVPSIACLMKVADALDQPVGGFFASAFPNELVSIVRRNERRPFVRRGAGRGFNYESVSYKRTSKTMEAFIMRPPRTTTDGLFFDHEGEELVFVLRGVIELRLKDRTYVLQAGDCSYFDSTIPHIHRNVGREQAEALVVVTKQSRKTETG